MGDASWGGRGSGYRGAASHLSEAEALQFGVKHAQGQPAIEQIAPEQVQEGGGFAGLDRLPEDRPLQRCYAVAPTGCFHG